MTVSSNAMLDLIESPEFIEAWRKVNDHSLLWDEFTKLPMPRGFTPEQLWDVVTSLRFNAGFVLPFKPYVCNLKGAVWFSIPKDTQIRLQQLSRSSHQSSALWQYIASNQNRYFRLFLYLDEVISVFERDGADIDRERVKGIWLGNEAPKTPNEVILSRLCTLLFSMGQYSHRRITHGLIEELYEHLTEGLDFDVQPTARLSGKDQTDLWDSGYALDMVCALADESVSEGLIHPIFSSINISGILWDHQPLPAFNATVDLLIKKVFYLQCNHPLLAYMPFSTITHRWELGQIKPDNGVTFAEVLRGHSAYGYDSTGFHAATIDLYIKELENLSSKIALFRERETEYQEKIARLPDLNHRQRNILELLLLAPGTRMSISTYQSMHHVSYATARNDLLDLVERGYFTMEVEDKAFLFSSSPNGLSLVDRGADGKAGEESF